jgi:hypothetical protein
MAYESSPEQSHLDKDLISWLESYDPDRDATGQESESQTASSMPDSPLAGSDQSTGNSDPAAWAPQSPQTANAVSKSASTPTESSEVVNQKQRKRKDRTKKRSKRSEAETGQSDERSYDRIAFETPFFGNAHGYRISQPYFARLWGTKRLAFYDRASGKFYDYNPENGCFDRLREDEVWGMLRDDIITEALKHRREDIPAKLNVGLCRSITDMIKADNHVCQDNFSPSTPLVLP